MGSGAVPQIVWAMKVRKERRRQLVDYIEEIGSRYPEGCPLLLLYDFIFMWHLSTRWLYDMLAQLRYERVVVCPRPFHYIVVRKGG